MGGGNPGKPLVEARLEALCDRCSIGAASRRKLRCRAASVDSALRMDQAEAAPRSAGEAGVGGKAAWLAERLKPRLWLALAERERLRDLPPPSRKDADRSIADVGLAMLPVAAAATAAKARTLPAEAWPSPPGLLRHSAASCWTLVSSSSGSGRAPLLRVAPLATGTPMASPLPAPATPGEAMPAMVASPPPPRPALRLAAKWATESPEAWFSLVWWPSWARSCATDCAFCSHQTLATETWSVKELALPSALVSPADRLLVRVEPPNSVGGPASTGATRELWGVAVGDGAGEYRRLATWCRQPRTLCGAGAPTGIRPLPKPGTAAGGGGSEAPHEAARGGGPKPTEAHGPAPGAPRGSTAPGPTPGCAASSGRPADAARPSAGQGAPCRCLRSGDEVLLCLSLSTSRESSSAGSGPPI